MEKQIRKVWTIEKLREKHVEIMGEKLSDKNDPYTVGKNQLGRTKGFLFFCHATRLGGTRGCVRSATTTTTTTLTTTTRTTTTTTTSTTTTTTRTITATTAATLLPTTTATTTATTVS